MRKSLLVILACMGLAACSTTTITKNELKLADVFTSNMVLQREMDVPVWGTSDSNSTVAIAINGEVYTTNSDNNGKWEVKLKPLPVGGPYKLAVSCNESSVKLNNILSGDVWVCSGQSNMQWSVSRSKDPKKEIAAAKYKNIRLFSVPRNTSLTPVDTVGGEWVECSPETIHNFSAVAYYFGRKLNKDLNVPIGLIHTSWGGTPAEAWTPTTVLNSSQVMKPIVDRHVKALALEKLNKKDREAKIAAHAKKSIKLWKKEYVRHFGASESGIIGWSKKDLDDSSWKSMKQPQQWETIIQLDGTVWFRRSVELSDDMIGKELTLNLGAIDDFDQTYVNGVKVGETWFGAPRSWATPRKYTVPAELVKDKKLVIAIRVLDVYGGGGLCAPGSAYSLVSADGKSKVKLAGTWKYKVEKEIAVSSFKRPPGLGNLGGIRKSHQPAALYNAMINPLLPYGIKGAIWYQGETNGGRGVQYRTLLPAMINSWRDGWNQGDFPFYIVQLANFKFPRKEPAEDNWAELREAQLMTALNHPNCGLAVTIDIGEAKDIHPRNKQDVGKRLALAALKQTYGKEVVHSGPTYVSSTVEGDKMVLKFKNIGGGMIAKDGKLKWFQIAGEDKVFFWADAEIKDDTVIVSSPKIKEPAAVRYGWSINPEGCNLYNKEGLPASPFRTDSWPVLSEKIF